MTDPQPVPASAPLPEPFFESADRRFRLYQGDCLALLPLLPEESFDMVFADPPYFLSNGGITCHAGRMVSVNKGKWDRSRGFAGNYAFTKQWLEACRRVMKPDATIWISGTSHIIHLVGSALDEIGFKILNDITWVKPNPPPNLSCRYFTHATETVIWAGRDAKTKHKYNYALMRKLAGGKQMKSVWTDIDAPRRDEKAFGKHPTQKPIALLERIIAASSDESDLVLDPFSGSGTTGIAAARLARAFSGIEMDDGYLKLAAMRYEGVPQADNPERVVALVKLHADGVTGAGALATELQLTERQIHYYRQAAEMLDLLDKRVPGTLIDTSCNFTTRVSSGTCVNQKGARHPFPGREGASETWRLTATGQQLIESWDEDKRPLLAARIIQLPIVKLATATISRCRGPDRQREAISQMLRRCTALGESTAIRRAQTLLAWIRWARGQPNADELPLYRDVMPAAEETNDSAVPEFL